MECSISLHFYVDKKETCKLEFWINGFFLSNKTIFGKFYMGLGIMWVMKPRERERERKRNALKSERRKFQIKEIRDGCQVGSFFIGFKFRFLF